MSLHVKRVEDALAGNDDVLAKEVARRIHATVLIRAEVFIDDPGALPLYFGKSRRVPDQRLDNGPLSQEQPCP